MTQEAVLVLQIIGTGLLGWVLRGVSEIKKDLRTQNGRIGKLETWKVEHEKRDDDRHREEGKRSDERHQEDLRDRTEIWGAVEKIRDRIS